ncbi:hypothetical protein N9H39_11535 [Gammaproteobacteria bacterium]|nr:hypothetical protein [Gammaproteobacteria bacterium]
MTKESRRNVLKGLAVTVPAVWATPVVESIILPAHAGISCGGLEPFDQDNPRHVLALESCQPDFSCNEGVESCMAEACIEFECDG